MSQRKMLGLILAGGILMLAMCTVIGACGAIIGRSASRSPVVAETSWEPAVSETTSEPEVTRSPSPSVTPAPVRSEKTETRKKPVKKVSKKPTRKPVKKVTKRPVKKAGYKNCTALRKDYPAGVPAGHRAYQSKMDRDGDDWACEPG